MKLKTTSQTPRTYDDVVAYHDIHGNLMLHPKYFSSSWTDVRGQQRTGRVDLITGIIYPPLGPEGEFLGYIWKPESYNLEYCAFAGDELLITL